MSLTTPNTDQHPDELVLVAFGEDRLLEFEHEEVELHLAECRACRDLLAALELPEQELDLEQARSPEHIRTWNQRLGWAVAAAAAAVFLVWFFDPNPSSAPRFELAVAGSREATFGSLRSAPIEAGEFFVGVRLEEPAWLRLVALDSEGGVHEVPLDPEGALTSRFAGASDHVFGPYPLALSLDLNVTRVFAVASTLELEWAQVAGSAWSDSFAEQGYNVTTDELDLRIRALPLKAAD